MRKFPTVLIPHKTNYALSVLHANTKDYKSGFRAACQHQSQNVANNLLNCASRKVTYAKYFTFGYCAPVFCIQSTWLDISHKIKCEQMYDECITYSNKIRMKVVCPHLLTEDFGSFSSFCFVFSSCCLFKYCFAFPSV